MRGVDYEKIGYNKGDHMNNLFKIAAVMALFSSVAYGMERHGIRIGKVINHSSSDAYLIIPGVERGKMVGKRFEELEEPVSLTKSIIIPTLPVYKMKEAYVFHHDDQSEEPLELNVQPGEHGYIIANIDAEPVVTIFKAKNYEELEIKDDGKAVTT